MALPPAHSNGPRVSGPDLRRAILDTTRHLLVEEGYNQLSMRKIARAVGCSATSIYLHFDSKDALFHALIDEGMERLYAQLLAAQASGGTPLNRLEAMCRQYMAFGIQNPEYYEVMFTLHAERMARYPAAKYRRARRSLETFAEVLEDAAAEGLVDITDKRIAASILWTSLHGAVTLMIARRIDARIDPAAYIDAVIRHSIEGFRHTPSTISVL
jgi:AcrR family transcriptional regulator